MTNPLPLFLFLGQSYFGKNSNNGRIIDHPTSPDALMLDGVHRLFGAGHMPMQAPYSGLVQAHDFDRRVQSPVTPFLYRYAAKAAQQDLPVKCIGHAESRSNASVEHLLPAEHLWHRTSSVYDNLKQAVAQAVMFGQDAGAQVYVPAIFFCQGTGDRAMRHHHYAARLHALFDALSTDIPLLTAQTDRPDFFVVQPPAKVAGGRWSCLQAQIDVCTAREDSTLALAGWAIPQHDRTHFSGRGTVALGELCAEVYLAHMRGENRCAPHISHVVRQGHVLVAETSGAAQIVVDTGPDTPRHRIDGLPLQHHGLQLDRGEIAEVSVDGTQIRIKLTPGTPSPRHLFFACATADSHGLDRNRAKANESTNRGNIRGQHAIESMFLKEPLYQWMASSIHAIAPSA